MGGSFRPYIRTAHLNLESQRIGTFGIEIKVLKGTGGEPGSERGKVEKWAKGTVTSTHNPHPTHLAPVEAAPRDRKNLSLCLQGWAR